MGRCMSLMCNKCDKMNLNKPNDKLIQILIKKIEKEEKSKSRYKCIEIMRDNYIKNVEGLYENQEFNYRQLVYRRTQLEGNFSLNMSLYDSLYLGGLFFTLSCCFSLTVDTSLILFICIYFSTSILFLLFLYRAKTKEIKKNDYFGYNDQELKIIRRLLEKY